MSGSIGPDDEFERLLRGETPETPEEHALGSFLDEVRGAFPAEPPLRLEAHLARVVEAAQLFADKGEPAVRPASKADGRGERASGLPKRRRVIVRVPLMRSLAAKVVAGAVVLLSMFGGLAFAGALPGQGSDDDASDVVEIQDLEADEPVETEEPEAEETEAPEAEDEDADDPGKDGSEGADESEDVESDDDQGEDADDQGEDADDQGEDADDEHESDDEDESDDNDESDDDDESDDESDDAGDSGEED